jgi:hypothetical protein
MRYYVLFRGQVIDCGTCRLGALAAARFYHRTDSWLEARRFVVGLAA